MPSTNLLAKTLGDTLIYARFTPEFLTECLKYWVDPDTRRVGLSDDRFAQLCQLSRRTVYNYINPDKDGKYRYPDNEALMKMGRFLGVHFVADWSGQVNNDNVLQLIKAQHAFHP